MRDKILNLPQIVLNDGFTTPIDFARVRENTRAITCIHSTDDPIVPYEEGAWVAKQANAHFITEQHAGHFIEFRPTGRIRLTSALEAILATDACRCRSRFAG
jgi:predicted alpha/beta hydrolase family esterase